MDYLDLKSLIGDAAAAVAKDIKEVLVERIDLAGVESEIGAGFESVVDVLARIGNLAERGVEALEALTRR
jgi:hypothetical protein